MKIRHYKILSFLLFFIFFVFLSQAIGEKLEINPNISPVISTKFKTEEFKAILEIEKVTGIKISQIYLKREAEAPPKIKKKLFDLRTKLLKKQIPLIGNKPTFVVGYTVALDRPLKVLAGTRPPKSLIFPIKTLPKYNISKIINLTCSPNLKYFNWRDRMKVSSVKDQGSCGSCWDFAGIGAFESSYAIINNKIIDASEQDVLDCSGAGSCSGGWIPFEYIVKNGVAKENNYPYTAHDQTCKKYVPRLYKGKKWGYLGTNKSVREIKKALCKYGPLWVTVRVTSAFQAYTGGVFNENANGPINHAVVLIGWDDKKNAWLIKNSWSKFWGENGYMWIRYGSNNICKHVAWIIAEDELCIKKLPRPLIRLTDGFIEKNRIKYKFSVLNYKAYPDKLFVSAPDLPPCGKNKNASRTWIKIYDQNNKYIYGFCALKKASQMKNLWFSIPLNKLKNIKAVKVDIFDRRCKKHYISRLIPLKLPRPHLISPPDGKIFSRFPRKTILRWSKVPEAKSYTVEIDCFHCCKSNKWCREVGRVFKIVKGIKSTSYTFNFVGAQPGRWRVWAVDAKGKEGFKSEWREFRYTR